MTQSYKNGTPNKTRTHSRGFASIAPSPLLNMKCPGQCTCLRLGFSVGRQTKVKEIKLEFKTTSVVLVDPWQNLLLDERTTPTYVGDSRDVEANLQYNNIIVIEFEFRSH